MLFEDRELGFNGLQLSARARRASLAWVMSRLSHMAIAVVERGKLGL